jgi:hypothetical protein
MVLTLCKQLSSGYDYSLPCYFQIVAVENSLQFHGYIYVCVSCMFSAIISVKFRVCFNPLQMGMFLKGLVLPILLV